MKKFLLCIIIFWFAHYKAAAVVEYNHTPSHFYTQSFASDKAAQSHILLYGAIVVVFAILSGIELINRRLLRQIKEVREHNSRLECENKWMEKLLCLNEAPCLDGLARESLRKCADVHICIHKMIHKSDNTVQQRGALRYKIQQQMESISTGIRQQLMCNTRTFIAQQPNGEQILPAIDSRQLMVLGLGLCRYSAPYMAMILGVSHSRYQMYMRKLTVRNSLISVGVKREQVIDMLFGDEGEEYVKLKQRK